MICDQLGGNGSQMITQKNLWTFPVFMFDARLKKSMVTLTLKVST